MEYSAFLMTRPGDCFLVGSRDKVVLARVPCECVLFTDGSTVPFGEVGKKLPGNSEDVDVTPGVYDYFVSKLDFLMAPGLTNLVTGDYVLRIVEGRATVLTVAFIDASRNTVYDQDGIMIPLNDPTMIRSGFWIEKKDGFLTEKGKQILSKIYH